MHEDSIEELMQKVHVLEMKARKLSRETFAGAYHASFKGQGLDFEDFREYVHGDEPRFIDWNVTARMHSPFVRTFQEERELNIIIAVDISGSSIYGSQSLSKRELAAELTAVLAFTAKMNGDKVGLLLFAEDKELYLPPEKGTKHVLRLIREVLATEASQPATNIANACRFLTKTVRRKSLIFMLSDFIAYDFSTQLGGLSKQHDLIALRLFDPTEQNLPDVGKITLTDPETNEQRLVNTSNANVRMGYQKLYNRHFESVQSIFRKYSIDYCDASTEDDYLPALHKLFKLRSRRHA